MAEKKTTAQIREEIVTNVFEQIQKACPDLFAEGAWVFHSGKKQFAIPMGTDDAPQACALISISVPQWKDTSKAAAFDIGFAEDELKMKEREKQEKAAARAKKKAEALEAAQARKAKRAAEKAKLQEKLAGAEGEPETEAEE